MPFSYTHRDVYKRQIDENRIQAMREGIREVINQPDPLHQLISEETRPSGLTIKAITVTLGVIGMIYESRPNVTIDAAALAIKSGNAMIQMCIRDRKTTLRCLKLRK